MSDLFLDMLDEMSIEECAEGTSDGFTVDTDEKAEWVIRKIRNEDEEYARIESACMAEIERYQAVSENARKNHERRTANLRYQLMAYMGKVKTKQTKTQASYVLPSAKLIIKHKQPKVIRDDAALIGWMRENAPEYIREKITYSPAWSDLKDTLIVSGTEYATADGVIVDGVTLEAQPDEFLIQYV